VGQDHRIQFTFQFPDRPKEILGHRGFRIGGKGCKHGEMAPQSDDSTTKLIIV
jgi:hypothetical protein